MQTTETRITAIIQDLETLPDRIEAEETLIWQLKNSILELEAVMETVKQKVYNLVCDEKEIDGKVKYSNDIKRRAEADLRLSFNEEYKKYVEQLKQDKKKLQDKEVYCSFLIRRFSAINSMCRLFGGDKL